MAKQMYKGYKGYLYIPDWTILEIASGTIFPATFTSLVLIKFIPPIGLFLSAVAVSITIGTGIAMGINSAINKHHSRKLFEDINNGNVDEVERRLDRISRKLDVNKEYILNNVRDKDGNTLIVSIIKSNINEEKKKELTKKMIDNGANIASILEKNANGKTPIEEVAEEKRVGHELLEFLAEKSEVKLESREAKYDPILEEINKKLENNTEEINNIETEIEKREEETESGFHPFGKIAIRALKVNLRRLKREREEIVEAKNKMSSKMKEKVTDKRAMLNRILNLDENEEFIDRQIQIE